MKLDMFNLNHRNRERSSIKLIQKDMLKKRINQVKDLTRINQVKNLTFPRI